MFATTQTTCVWGPLKFGGPLLVKKSHYTGGNGNYKYAESWKGAEVEDYGGAGAILEYVTYKET